MAWRSGWERGFSFVLWLLVTAGSLLSVSAIVVPLCFHVLKGAPHQVLLWALSALAACAGLFVAQIGCGSFFWIRKYHKLKDVDWFATYQQERAQSGEDARIKWEDVRHFVVVPNYKEGLELLQLMFYALLTQRSNLTRSQMVVVLAMEEREGAAGKMRAQALKTEFERFFLAVRDTYHPDPRNNPDEIPGKASNYKWAVKCIEEWVDAGEYGPPDHVLVHCADADSLYDPNFFANVTYSFCMDQDRYSLIWQPCMTPTCNFWDVPSMCRLTNLMVCAEEMASASLKWEFQVPFSTWGLSLLALKQIGDDSAKDAQDGDVIADDHHLFVKGFFKTRGKLRCEPIFLPCLNFSVGDDPELTYFGNLYARYEQAKRHMFGIAEYVYLLELLVQKRWCCGCGFSGASCFSRMRTMNLWFKLTKIHGITVCGLWVPLGGVLFFVLKFDLLWCRHSKAGECDVETLDSTLNSFAAWCYSGGTGFAIIGSILAIWQFVRMLAATHYLLMNIADPNGSFASPSVFGDSREPLRRRPIRVAGGFPWIGCVLQLAVEFAVLGLFTSFIFAAVPSYIAITKLFFNGHRLNYVVAPKPSSQSAGTMALASSMVKSPRATGDLQTRDDAVSARL
jgi:hypothetical protein